MKKFTFGMLIITLIMFIGLNFFSNPSVANVVYSPDDKRDVYLNIMTCNKPQYEMLKLIVEDKHNVEFMFNDEKVGSEFQSSSAVINNISNMDLFFYSGRGYEPWSTDFIEELDKSKLGVIDVSRGIRTISMEEKTNTDNPYYWLGIDEYKIALYNIKSAIQDKDPQNRNLYEDNYNKAIENLELKVKAFDSSLEGLKNYQFVSLDNNLDYFFRKLGISPIYMKGQAIEKVIEDNKLDKTKVIVIKDSKSQFPVEGYNVVNLYSYNDSMDFEQIILNNYKAITEITKPKP